MEYTHWSEQIISLAGAFIVLTAYIGHQLKWEFFNPDKYMYNLFNAIASVLLVYAALNPFQAGFLVMETAWGLVSLYTIIRIYRKNKGLSK